MRTDIAIEKLCDVAPYLGDIAEGIKKDEEFKTFILKYQGEQKNNLAFVFRVLPMILKKFKNEVFSVLAIIGEKSVDEIKEQPFGVTVSQVKELIEDEDFRSFFPSFSANTNAAEE